MAGLETVETRCPYCGSPIELVVDCSVGSQCYVEDCEVCCRPIEVSAAGAPGDVPSVSVAREDDV